MQRCSVHLLERTFPTKPQIPYDPLWSKKSSCSHRPHMNHCGQIPRYRCAFWIPPPEDQCGTVTGGECVYHTVTHPTWTIVDLVWNTCVFWIPPHEDQCGTLTGGECVYHPDNPPHMNHCGPCLIYGSVFKYNPMSTSVELWLVENVFIIQPPTQNEPLWTLSEK